MSLFRNTVEAVRAIREVETRNAVLDDVSDSLAHTIVDARQFLSEFRNGIELAPLQIYHAGLLFCPKTSHIRRNYGYLQDPQVYAYPLAESWSSCLHTLEGHSTWVRSVVFSPDGKQVASGSDDTTVRIWDAETGQSLHALEGHSKWVRLVVFSPDGKQVASGSHDNTVRIWDVEKGSIESLLENTFATDVSQLRSLLHWEDHALNSNLRSTAHMSLDSKWLIQPDGHFLWIPPALRPSAFASSPQYAVLGTGSGRVTFLSFKL